MNTQIRNKVAYVLDEIEKKHYSLIEHDKNGSYWTGYLSSSALSTALACIALRQQGTEFSDNTYQSGLHWLLIDQGEDGSWGDTSNSPGNVSTSILVWAALYPQRQQSRIFSLAYEKVSRWIEIRTGGLKPRHIQKYIETAYGNDKTFSVPIMSACIIAGCFEDNEDRWTYLRQLPFELSAFPQSLYAFLHLPVVSYALPALIAIGLSRHQQAATKNIFLRSVRNSVRQRCLKKLQSIQPSNGGFLEATPLSAFVAMNLHAAGEQTHCVYESAMKFIIASQRTDGSWPIDTNLSCWVSSLTLQALTVHADRDSCVDRSAVASWISSQQHQHAHVYTASAAGGWAWSDLPGAVPDADDTSSALISLSRMRSQVSSCQMYVGAKWLLSIQNRDGGMPTFCRGWGALPFDHSCPDITAHALAALQSVRSHVADKLHARIDRSIQRCVVYLKREQRCDGSWIPLWFGSQYDEKDQNPLYGTARAPCTSLWAY